MTQSQRSRPAFAALAFVALSMCLGIYFTFAAVQGDYGLFRRAEVQQQASELRLELAQVQAEVTRMENLTRRLSDECIRSRQQRIPALQIVPWQRRLWRFRL